jgi:hypothetical protein
VVNVGVDHGEQYVEVRDPSGENTATPGDEGFKRLTLKQFIEGFAMMTF